MSKEELRRQYRHRPPPPKDPSQTLSTTSNKEDNCVVKITPTDESEELWESDNISVVHDYEEIDLEDFRVMAKSRDPLESAISKLKSKEELRKLYKHRAPPKLPTITDSKEDNLADAAAKQTEETPSTGVAQHCDSLEQSSPFEQRSQEVTQEECRLPPEKQLHTQPLSDSTIAVPTTNSTEKNVAIHGQEMSSFVDGQLEDQPMSCKPLHSTAEGSSSHLELVSDSKDDYMPLIPKRKKKNANSDYETLNFQQ